MMRSSTQRPKTWNDLAIGFIILNSLGFPGNFKLVFGNIIGDLVDYSAFLMMIALMLLNSADRLMDIVIIELKAEYRYIYMLLGVFCATSIVATSGSPTELITCIRLGVTVFFAIWLCERYTLCEVLERVFASQAVYLLFTMIFVTVFSSYVYRESAGYASDFVGLYSAKNGIGSELAFGILMQVLLLNEYRLRKRSVGIFFICVLLVQVVLLAMTHNWGSFFCLAVPLFYIYWRNRVITGIRLPLGLMYIAGSIAFLIFALTIIPLFTPFFEAIGKDATLTGRIPLWRQALKVLKGIRFFIGYGYGMFWRNSSAVDLIHRGFDQYSFMAQQTSGAHNVLVELFLNNGIIGVLTLFVTMLGVFRRCSAMKQPQYTYCAGFIILFMVYGFTERSFGTHEFLTLFLFYTWAVACNSRQGS